MADVKALAEELVNLTVKDVQELAKVLKEEYGIEVDKRKIRVEDIKSFGTYNASIKLFEGVKAEIKVQVSCLSCIRGVFFQLLQLDGF